MKKIQQLIACILLFLFIGGYIVTPVQAMDEPPTAPDAPSAPVQEATPPTSPTAPEAPSVPTQQEVLNPATPTPTPVQHEEEKTEESAPRQKRSSTQATTTPTPAPDATATSGGQDASNGTNGAVINAGAATVSGTAVNNANTNSATSPGSGGTGATISNTGNGQGSDNSASTSNNNNSLNDQNNSAEVNNDLNLSAVSGYNKASDNSGGAIITTQDANASGTVINSVNTNVDGVMVAEFNVNDVQTGDLVLDFAENCVSGCGANGDTAVKNSGNLEDSTNTASSTSNTNDASFQNNDANVGNNLILSADSGHNKANDNVGGDTSITTGDANVTANSLTFANNNFSGDIVYGVVNIYGELYGDIILPEEQVSGCSSNCGSGSTAVSNTGNGANSTNTASSTNNTNDATFQNNDATIGNNVVVDITTGDNGTSDNIGDGSTIETGNSNVVVNTVNVANSNVDGGTMWLVIVNEAGKWIGRLLGSPDGSNMAGSAGTEFVVGEDGQVNVSNTGNGADSTNTASTNNNNNSTTVQNNTANVSNNLNLSANTGGNRANDNGGGDTTIKTGDAKIIANIVNFVNNNVTGSGKLVVTVVNVFGKWFGDFVTPGQKKQSDSAANTAQNTERGHGGETSSAQVSTNSITITPTPTVVLTTTQITSKSKKVSVAGTSSTLTSDFGDIGKALEVKVAAANTMEESVADAKEVITFNLAWVVLLAPFLIGSIFTSKKFSLFSILARRISMMLW